MTFYEAALRVLEREGKPLHVNAIIEAAVKENLLSHVGKSPEDVMQSRLLAMARRRADRKIVATAPLTYGLIDWGIPEDPAALEPSPEDGKRDEGPPLRPRERHPVPSPEKARIAGRGERMRGKRREEEEGRKRRKLPPLPEVAFEILSSSGGPMSAVDLAASARDRELVTEDLGAEALLHALKEENRRRSEAGRKAQFFFGPNNEISLEKGAAAEGGVELEAAVAFAMGMPLVGGPKREEPRGPGAARLVAQALEHRRQILRLVRRRLGDLDSFSFEKAAGAFLEQQGFRELRILRRSKDGTLLSARKREGLVDLRYAVRLHRGNDEVGKAEVEELRRELGQAGGQLAMIVAAGDAHRDARQEAQAAGLAPVVLMCGEALAEKCLEKRIGAASVTLEVFDLDEEFFKRCRERGREEAARRGEPREEGERRPQPGQQPPPERAERPERPERPQPRQQATPEEREKDAQALAAHLTSGASAAPVDAETQKRRQEEAQARLSAHERIEAAEIGARRQPQP